MGYVFNPSIYIYMPLMKKIKLLHKFTKFIILLNKDIFIYKNTFCIKNHDKKISKAFHVSPFMSLSGFYKFKSYKRNKNLSIFIEYFSKKENLFASFHGKKKRCLLVDYFLNF